MTEIATQMSFHAQQILFVLKLKKDNFLHLQSFDLLLQMLTLAVTLQMYC